MEYHPSSQVFLRMLLDTNVLHVFFTHSDKTRKIKVTTVYIIEWKWMSLRELQWWQN